MKYLITFSMFLVIMHLNLENTAVKSSRREAKDNLKVAELILKDKIEELNNQKRVTLMLRGYIKGNEEKKLQKNNEYLDLLNKI
jgi:hypothetical protein